MGIGFAAAGLALSVLAIKDTGLSCALEAAGHAPVAGQSLRHAFAAATWRRPHLGRRQPGRVRQQPERRAGLGIFPVLRQPRLSFERVGLLAAAYPLVWALLQLGTGWSSDRVGRKPLIVAGMLLQGCAFAVAIVDAFAGWIAAVSLLGIDGYGLSGAAGGHRRRGASRRPRRPPSGYTGSGATAAL
jgi:MFS family permease